MTMRTTSGDWISMMEDIQKFPSGSVDRDGADTGHPAVDELVEKRGRRGKNTLTDFPYT
ncbi:hypothetical protein SAMN05443245_7189 [Paraburkholderia fungorum]|uniref:Uncharacterized protein n=1 Tax=Paraburkholderia fungorum TaxID=134537 RepID=A0A1H1JQZ2_9BURK|nr:hypothetical protein SAMN05443245_7189 [Paraburkholderia fungorum]